MAACPSRRVGSAGPTVDDKILMVDEALEALEALDPVECRVVKLRYFVGLNHAEIGSLLGLSERSVKRYWSFAKVWLYRWIQEHR